MYKNVQDAYMNNKSDLSNVGKRIILPSTFIGSSRNMHKLYQNTMALIGKFGKPDLFITFTCNSNWPEIQPKRPKNEGMKFTSYFGIC